MDALVCILDFNSVNPEDGAKKILTVQQNFPKGQDNIVVVKVDACVFPDNSVASGCVFKDRDLKIHFATSTREFISVPPDLVMTIRWSFNLALSLGFECILLQSDDQTVVDNINSIAWNVVLEPIAADCRLLFSKFKIGCVMFIGRLLNFDAHIIVGLGIFWF